MDYVDLIFAPDLDTSWTKNPGALSALSGFAPTQQGYLASIGYGNLLGAAVLASGGDINRAQLFRQVSNSVRMLAFRPGNIDEYDNAGTRTNRGTGYTGTTWDAAAWGNQIIACNATDAVQASTGGAFAALGGGSGKARYIAANMDQAVLYDIDDGLGYAFPDAVAWSQFRNPSVYTPAPSTQAGRTRLLSVPGPARGIVAYQAGFVAFKDNGFFVGKYVGPQKVMSWVPVSKRIGCIAPFSIVECDGKLYWLHSSGFWCWDGQNLQNIGLPVIQSFLATGGYVILPDGRVPSPLGTKTYHPADTQAVADDIEGVVWFTTYNDLLISGAVQAVQMSYNVRTGRWGAWTVTTATSGHGGPVSVRGTFSDLQAFKSDGSGRIWQIWPTGVTTAIQSVSYPGTTIAAPTLSTGVYGDQLQSARQDQLVLRHVRGTSALVMSDVTGLQNGYATEDLITVAPCFLGQKAMSWDVSQSSLKGGLDAPFKQIDVAYAAGKKIILGGCGIPQKAKGAR